MDNKLVGAGNNNISTIRIRIRLWCRFRISEECKGGFVVTSLTLLLLLLLPAASSTVCRIILCYSAFHVLPRILYAVCEKRWILKKRKEENQTWTTA